MTTLASKLRIGLDSNGLTMTPREFDGLAEYDDNYRYELIRGVLVVSPIPSEAEAGPNDLLGFLLRCYREFHSEGKSLDDTLPERYVRTADSRRRADRVIWAGLGRRPDPKKDTPTIAVEFVSSGRRSWQRDYEDKRREYLLARVGEYWLIDRFRRTMTIFQRKRPQKRVIGEGEVYRTPLLPGFELPLDKLLDAADRWEN